MQTIFFLNVQDWDEGQKYSISVNPFESLLVLGASLFEYVRTEGFYLNITSKLVAKINTKKSQTVLKS